MTRTNLFGAIRVTAIMAAVGLLGLTTQAQSTRTWDAAVDGDWSLDGNWDAPTAPVDDDSVIFGATGDGTVNTMDIPDLSLTTFTVDKADHTTDLDGKTLTVDNLIIDGTGGADYTGRLHVANGTLQVDTLLKNAAGNLSHVYITLDDDAILKAGRDTDNRAQILLGTESSQMITYLTAGELLGDLYLSNLKVGSRGASLDGGYAEFNLLAVTNAAVIDVSTSLEVAVGRSAAGRMLLSDSIDLKVGSESARATQIHVGDSLRSGSNYLPPGQSAVSEMILGAGRFDVYATNLRVGTGQDGVGLINATNSVGGIIDVVNLRLGEYNQHAAPSGRLWLSDVIPVKVGSESARGNITTKNGSGTLVMGTNTFEAWLDDLSVSRMHLHLGNVKSGLLDVSENLLNEYRGPVTITLSDGFVTKFGDPAKRLAFDFMSDNAYIGTANAQCNLTAGGTFHAWLGNVRIGYHGSSNANARAQFATVDFSSVTNLIFDVEGNMDLASKGQDNRVTLILPAYEVRVSTNLAIGTTDFGNTSSTHARGDLIMTGTHFRVGGNVTLDGYSWATRSKVITTVTGSPAGLDLAAGSDLNINNGEIEITFAEDPDNENEVYWGLRWEGDKVAELEALETDGKLTWDDSAIPQTASIFASGGFTYVGIPPPAGTLIRIR